MRSSKVVFVVIFGLLSVSGCDIPTEAPRWDSHWIVPTQTTEIALDEFLPAGVAPAPDGLSFVVYVAGFSESQSLDQLCSPCSMANGLTVPKPSFSGTLPLVGGLPAEVVSAELAEGRFEVELTNGFSFDPIRPRDDNVGQITVRVFNVWAGGVEEEIGAVTVDGADTALPPGGTVSRELILTPGPISPALRAEVFLSSPEGDLIEIDTSEAFEARFEALMFRVASAEVDISGRQLQLDEIGLDLEDVNGELIDRVRSGGFALDVENPFGVALDLTLQIGVPGIATVEKSMSISAAETSTASVSLTGDELRSFLGRPGAMLSGEAEISPTAPTFTVRPGQVLSFDTEIDVSLRMGGGS